MVAKDLNDEQKVQFTNYFYDRIDASLPGELVMNDTFDDNPYPWGCPWLFSPNLDLGEGTVSEQVDRYIVSNSKAKADLIREDLKKAQDSLDQVSREIQK